MAVKANFKGAEEYYDLEELLDGFKDERLAKLIKNTNLDPEVIIYLVRSGWGYDFAKEEECFDYGDLFDAIDDWYSNEDSLSRETRDALNFYFFSHKEKEKSFMALYKFFRDKRLVRKDLCRGRDLWFDNYLIGWLTGEDFVSMIKEITEGFGKVDEFYYENYTLFDQALEFNTTYELYNPLLKRHNLLDIIEEVSLLFDRILLFFGQNKYAMDDIYFAQKSKGRYEYDLCEEDRKKLASARNNVLRAFAFDECDRDSITSIINDIMRF